VMTNGAGHGGDAGPENSFGAVGAWDMRPGAFNSSGWAMAGNGGSQDRGRDGVDFTPSDGPQHQRSR